METQDDGRFASIARVYAVLLRTAVAMTNNG